MLSRLISNHGIVRIVEALEGSGGNARLVGGCVRDSMIGRETTDIDLATDLMPDSVIKTLESVGIRTIPTGIRHGTVTAVVDGTPYEITTLRRDVECDGRHATVAFTNNWMEDASRRDFTFNALYCDKYGKVYDYFSGMRDLANRTVAFIGNAEARISEDFLRILRVFRFHASICSTSPLSAEIIDLCSKHANSISKLSKERIRSEFFKLLACTNCVATLQIMKECGVLSQVVPHPVHVHRLSCEYLAGSTPITKLAAILKGGLHAEMINTAEELEVLLRLSRKEKKFLKMLLTVDLPLPLSPTQQQKYLNDLGKDVYESLIIVSFLCKETPCESALLEHLEYAKRCTPLVLPVSGKDLAELGYKEGKLLGHTLKRLKEVWERDTQSVTRQHLLLLAKQFLEDQQKAVHSGTVDSKKE
ncbi:CCA tRNA nucleotidyltransferase [Anaplasma capra]|uniref:CCA tRNA nucleotidyltransferase n=1 Tax=Anaplasma capra TaxID=1562740 RepID=UPI0021D57849|nr:CCA tRNA nucleotidyltransferase [Anaplasma capra]MCU7611314.1 CCA tRNA nucleotidyltransferase [Anaplasma capra]MCU7612733.1 CCA tRNA nucleotidyltransferase [Anaplasma capra]